MKIIKIVLGVLTGLWAVAILINFIGERLQSEDSLPLVKLVPAIAAILVVSAISACFFKVHSKRSRPPKPTRQIGPRMERIHP